MVWSFTLCLRPSLILFNLLIGLDGYTICSRVISQELNGPNIVAKPLKVEDYMEIGYIIPGHNPLSQMTKNYIKMLEKSVSAQASSKDKEASE